MKEDFLRRCRFFEVLLESCVIDAAHRRGDQDSAVQHPAFGVFSKGERPLKIMQ
jgi:hypothetical protein